MNIFCDESGGFDGDKHSFVIGAVQITSGDASRLIKQFRKASGIRDEIKGGLLLARQRSIFFSMLGDTEGISAAVACHKQSQLGGWASRCFAEHEVFAHMMIEVCQKLIVNAAPPFVNIVADGGRYSKGTLEKIRDTVCDALSFAGARISVDFVSSAETHGVQVADVVSNTVYQATPKGILFTEHQDILSPMMAGNRLFVSNATLSLIRPSWIAAE